MDDIITELQVESLDLPIPKVVPLAGLHCLQEQLARLSHLIEKLIHKILLIVVVGRHLFQLLRTLRLQ